MEQTKRIVNSITFGKRQKCKYTRTASCQKTTTTKTEFTQMKATKTVRGWGDLEDAQVDREGSYSVTARWKNTWRSSRNAHTTATKCHTRGLTHTQTLTGMKRGAVKQRRPSNVTRHHVFKTGRGQWEMKERHE